MFLFCSRMPVREPSRYENKGRAIPQERMRLGDMLRWRMVLYLTCRHCHHTALVDIGAVGEKAGYDLKLPELVQRARCTKCGSDEVRPIVQQGRVRPD